MRSRNHSCDQCRKSKRACDAPRLTYFQDIDSLICLDNPHSPAPRVRPCSYCAKTKKECTVNWAWSQLRISKAMEAASSGSLQLDSAGSTKRQKLDMPNIQVESSTVDSISGFMRNSLQDLPPPWLPYDGNAPEVDEIFGDTSNIAESQWTGPTLEENMSVDNPSRCSEDSFLSSLSFLSATLDHQPPLLSQVDLGLDISPWHVSQEQSLPVSSSQYVGLARPTQRKRKKQRLTGHTWPQQTATPLSSFSMDQSMMARSNQSMISQNLLRIYHDVLEHSLSCWLSEVTCPYQPNGDFSQKRDSVSEWGSSWSNRMYEGTLKLDQAARSTKLIKISSSEDQACTRALHLAIMAFATQWAQGSSRQREPYSPLSDSFDAGKPEGAFDDLVEEFDRSLQWHFWSQAERALQDVSHIESFRVVCAETVFGLTQKPWPQETLENSTVNGQTSGLEEQSLTSQIAQEISRDGPPMYLERAARKMHALKFKFDSAIKHISYHRDGGASTDTVQSMGQEDKTMVGLLYWLAIMFDTVSASMNERPVVVPDQDSHHASCRAEEADDAYWKVELFIQDKLEAPCHTIRWPCTYEVAASAVTRSAPVKVLLYRHVSYLQNTLRRGQSVEKVEQVIQNATSLYRYWNLTYGAFFRDLIHNYNSVPGRIQSWFVCISAHWHLACLILVDLINTVDQKNLGIKSRTQMRLRSRVVAKMQETSVKELSDLARVATPPSEETNFFQQLPGFHPCVNEGTILTEPWTAILIRAFSRAAVWLLEDAESYGQYGLGAYSSDGLSDTLEQAEYCIKGLWFLGKKSDMARRVADILTRALSGLKN